MEGSRLRVLGIAQDGGLPHAACNCVRCAAAREDPARASGVASVGIIAAAAKKVFLVDATPDITAQLQLLADVRESPAGRTDREPLDGIFLTHAHIGHYLGLAYLGFEAVSTKNLPLWASPRMGDFLRNSAPWDRLVSGNHVRLEALTAGEAIALPDGLSVTPFMVPHRAEYTDTVGYIIAGARQRTLYIPDTSPWEAWDPPLEAMLDEIDVALLDATFYSGDELPGRDLSKIGHPLVVDSMDRLQSRVDSGKLEVWFTHLNHSNPALDPDSEARQQIEARGFAVAQAGLEIAL